MSRWTCASALFLVGVGCGDLSNQNVLFAAALPDSSILVTIPGGNDPDPQVLGNTAWVLQTQLAQTAATHLNTFPNQLLQHFQAFATRSPSASSAGHASWSAVYVPATGLYATMTMDALPAQACDVSFDTLPSTFPSYTWTIFVSARPDQGFVSTMSGVVRGDGSSLACGQATVNAAASRAGGITYSDATLQTVDAFTETWQRSGQRLELVMSVGLTNASDGYLDEAASYVFEQSTDASGVFQFAIRDDVRGNGAELMQTVLQWGPSGLPWRADFCVDAASGPKDCGTGCGPKPPDRTFFTDALTGEIDGNVEACGDLIRDDPERPIIGRNAGNG